jgi:uncharacterized protein
MLKKSLLLKLILVLLLALFVYGFWIEPRSLVIKHVTLPIAGLKAPIKAVLIGDPQPMNTNWPPERMRWAMDRAQAQKPDIVFFVGDYAYETKALGYVGLKDWMMVNPADTVAAMARLKAPMGVYAVLGNHDWWWNGPEMIRLLGKTHIQLLMDDARLAQHGKQALWVAGLEDMATPRPYDLPGTLAKTDQRAPVILLSHSPDIFPQVPQQVALTLAGHTHGGQVYIPGIGRPIVPIDNKQYARGLFTEKGRQLYVTSGIGTAIIPVRFLTPPEIVVLHLVPRK